MRDSLIEISSALASSGVHVMGDFQGNSSLSRSARDVVEVVRSLKVPVETMSLALSPERHQGLEGLFPEDSAFREPKSRLSIAHCNGDSLAYIARRLPSELFADRRIIGVWYWETGALPESHRQGYDFVDEIWVTSKFVADSISKSSPVPVRHFPHLMEVAESPLEPQLPSFLSNDRFVFLFCFDYRSHARRKNPEGVCEAFVRAFPEASPDGPVCVIKSFSGQELFGLDHLELRLRFRQRSDIVFIDEWYSPLERDSLMARADCYVSLHRAEGLGMTLLESMALGKPCIATAYSGNLDFMTEENSWLIPATMIPVGPGGRSFPPDHLWADPDLAVAAEAMRQVYLDRDKAKRRGELGRGAVKDRHNVHVVGGRIAELLEEAIHAPVRPKPRLGAEIEVERARAATARARAYEFLKQSREQSVKMRSRIESKRPDGNAARDIKSLLDVIRLQQKAQSEILKELGELKRRLKEQETSGQQARAWDRELMAKILLRLEGSGVSPLGGKKSKVLSADRLQDRIREIVPTLSGWCSVEKAQHLASIVVALRPEVIVEVGVYAGRSLIPMALACQEIGRGRIVGIDAWNPQVSASNEVKENAEWWSKLDHEVIYEEFVRSLDLHGLSGFVDVVRSPSDGVDPPVRIDLLHIDGSHTDQAIKDVERFSSKVPAGGIVVMDDLDWTGGGVLRAVRLLLETGFRELYKVTKEKTDNWAVYQRL